MRLINNSIIAAAAVGVLGRRGRTDYPFDLDAYDPAEHSG